MINSEEKTYKRYSDRTVRILFCFFINFQKFSHVTFIRVLIGCISIDPHAWVIPFPLNSSFTRERYSESGYPNLTMKRDHVKSTE